MLCRLATYNRDRKDYMGGFLGALKGAGKAIARREKKRYGFMPSAPKGPSAGSAGADPVADAVSADRRKKRAGKARE